MYIYGVVNKNRLLAVLNSNMSPGFIRSGVTSTHLVNTETGSTKELNKNHKLKPNLFNEVINGDLLP